MWVMKQHSFLGIVIPLSLKAEFNSYWAKGDNLQDVDTEMSVIMIYLFLFMKNGMILDVCIDIT